MTQEPLINYLRSCCVQVLGQKPGCGFFIAPQLVVTCSHVVGRDVEEFSEIQLERWSESSVESIYGSTVIANFSQDDIAFIRTSEPNKSFVPLGKNIRRGHELTAIGFPYIDEQKAFDQFTAQYEGRTLFMDSHGRARADTKFKSGQVEAGFSGGPLLNLETSRVVGVVALSRDTYSDLGGWAIEMSVVERLLQECHQALPDIDPGWTMAAAESASCEEHKERRDSSQEKLLMSLTTEIIERLNQSFPNNVRIPCVIKRQDSLVQKPWSTLDTQNDHQAEETLNDADKILRVFDTPELSQQLLILGEPGAGKTVVLLELAEGLLRRAKAKRTEPLPVIVDLSSWTEDQSIFDWLLQELEEKYRVPPSLTRTWIEQSQLLFLLDGFDEVEPKAYSLCASALNEWLLGPLEQQPCGVVICSRKEEFCELEKPPLNLHGAVYLQSLSDQKIIDYLAELQLKDIWQDVRNDESLRDLLTKPLFLSIFGLAQRRKKFSLTDWRSCSDTNNQVSYLLDIYLEAAFSQDLIIDPQSKQQGILSKTYGRDSLPTLESTMRTLIFTAKGLEEESRADFLIEKIQPTWLQTADEKETYNSLLCILIMVPFILCQLAARSFLPELSLLLFTFPWLRLWVTRNDIVPAEKLRFSKLAEILSDYRPNIRIFLTFISLSFFGLSWLVDLIGQGWRLVLVVPITGVMINMSLTWLIENIQEDVVVTAEANQGMKNLWSNMLRFLLLLLPIAALLLFRFNIGIEAIADKSFSMRVIVSYVVYVIGYALFEAGGKSLIQHTALRLVCFMNQYAPVRYDKMLDYCTERLFLQRLGGRYRFVHRLLQEYFAKMTLS